VLPGLPQKTSVKEVLQQKENLKYLIEPNALLKKLSELHVLTADEMLEVMFASERDVYTQAERLIACFTDKSEEHCQQFLKALEQTSQQHVANFIKYGSQESGKAILCFCEV
jgi:hypothetical protein